MLEYDRIDISEGIDINKCDEASKECSLCKFYYFLDKNFKYGPYLCDGSGYNMSMKTVSMQNLTIINDNGNHYRVNFAFMTKKDAYNLIKNAIIMGEKGTLQNNLLSAYNIKMSSQKIKFGDKEVDKKNSIHLKKLFH